MISNFDLIDRKLQAQRVAEKYLLAGYDSYYQRITDCFNSCLFVEKNSIDLPWRLVSARFCRVKLCPVCQWRKARRWQSRFLLDIPHFINQNKNVRFLFLTLTVKNCLLKNISDTIDWINKSYAKLVNYPSWPALGWFKSLELSFNKGLVHPHYHCLLAIPSIYYQDNYLHQSDWVALWRKALKVDYDPLVWVTKINPKDFKKAIPEIVKYGLKPSNFEDISYQELDLLTQQINNKHFVSKGGIFRNYFKDFGSDFVDLIGRRLDGSELTGGRIFYRFNLKNSSLSYQYYHGSELMEREDIDYSDRLAFY